MICFFCVHNVEYIHESGNFCSAGVRRLRDYKPVK